MSRRWMLTLAGLFIVGAFGDYTVLAFWSANWQAIGRVLAVVAAVAIGWSVMFSLEKDTDEISRTAYLSRPDHERAGR
jgi:membrane protein implicated in regulation of membrane protease activity